MRVLFVDDERDLVSSLSRYFRLHGFETAGAYGVADAVARLEEARAGASPYDASVEAMRLGAVTMLEKPVPAAQLEREVRDAIADAREVEGGLEAAGGAGLVGNSPAIRAL